MLGVLAAIVVAAAGGGWWYLSQPRPAEAGSDPPKAAGKPAPASSQAATSAEQGPAKSPPKQGASPQAQTATPPPAKTPPAKNPATAPPAKGPTTTPPVKTAPATPPKTDPVQPPPDPPPSTAGDAFLGQWLPDDGSKVDPSTDLLRIVRQGNRLVGQIPDPDEGYLLFRATSASKLNGTFIGSDGTRMNVTVELLSKNRLMMTVVTPDGDVETIPLRRVGNAPHP